MIDSLVAGTVRQWRASLIVSMRKQGHLSPDNNVDVSGDPAMNFPKSVTSKLKRLAVAPGLNWNSSKTFGRISSLP